MAIYRQLHTTFWKDKRVGEWTRDQKLFFLYLLSNDNTTQCGVYEFNRRYAEFELNMTTEEVQQHIDFLVSKGRIVFNEKTEELIILNWLKYNNAKSPKVASVIDKELKEVKTFEFELEVIKKCQEYGYPIKTKEPKKNSVSIGYGYGMDTISQPTPSPTPSPTDNQHHHQQADEPADPVAVVSDPFRLYQEIFGVLNSVNSEDIKYWINDLSEELVCEAMKRAGVDQKSYHYAQGIMRNWAKRNIDTMEKVHADDVRYKNQAKRYHNNSQTRKIEKVPVWMQDKTEVDKKAALSPEQHAELDTKLSRFLEETEKLEAKKTVKEARQYD